MSFLTLVTQTSPNTSLGFGSLVNVIVPNATGNVAIGPGAGAQITTGDFNTALGNNALILNQTGNQNTAVGGSAMSGSVNAIDNVAVGYQALSQIGGNANTAIGAYAGSAISTGAKNSILGGYTGNQGGLDIRTLSNYIVLSDGDGNPRLWIDNTGAASIPGGILSPTISGSLTITGGTVTASNPVLQATQTWNNAGVAFTGWQLNITDTASAAGSLLMDLQVGGNSKFYVDKIGRFFGTSSGGANNWYFGTRVSSNFTGLAEIDVNTAKLIVNGGNAGDSGSVAFRFSAGSEGLWVAKGIGFGNTTSPVDLYIYRDAANTLAQRNGVNWQAFRVYSTYTDASNYERIEIRQSGASWFIGNNSLGTGPGNRNINFSANGQLVFGANGGSNWLINTSGHFLANADNTYDIGASGANRPRNLFLGGNITLGGSSITSAAGGTWSQPSVIEFAAGGHLRWAGRSKIYSEADGNFSLYNNATTDFDRLQFGGTTASFPALKRRSANLQTVGADDTGTAGFIVGNQALATTATDGFIYVPSCAGVPTGVPTAYTGTIPHVVDTTNKHAYWYIAGAWWRANLV